MIKKRIALVTALLIILSLSSAGVMAQGKGKQKNAPFLITGKLPHLTKLLIQQWDNAELHLSAEQKSQLLVIREETISGVQKLGKDIEALEKQVVEGSLTGEAPEELQSIVQDIATLKIKATMLHLRCIYKTSKILDQKQLDFLQS